MSQTLILILFLLFMFGLQVFSFVKRYIKVPPDKIMVVYGRTSQNPDEKYIIHTSGSHFVWPVIQEHVFVDTTLRNLKVEVKAQDSQQEPLFWRIAVDYRISNKAEIATKFVELNGIGNEDSSIRMIQDKVSRTLKSLMQEQEKSVILTNSEGMKIELEEKLKKELEMIGLELTAIGEIYLR